MKIIVHNATVGKNIELFRRAVEKLKSKNLEKSRFEKTKLQGFVNCVTGEICFEKDIETSPEKWRAIHLYVGEEGDFLVIGIDESQFSIHDFFPTAYRSMIETVKVLNLSLQLLQGRVDIDLLLKQLNELEIAVSKDIVHDAWHQVDRIGAERLLEKELSGTYLFRKDEYAAILEDQLIVQHKTPIKCLTLSYLDKKNRVIDLTVVKKEDRWLYYDDDPSLNGPLFPDVFALLNSLGDELNLALQSI
ncbi:MAG: SH2 domain-containing protein [Chlamydiota bacterium]